MTKSELIAAFERAADEQRILLRTRKTYLGCILRWREWLRKDRERAELAPAHRISFYLSEKAAGWSASTQNQALNALIWFHRNILEMDVGELPEWTYAQKPKRLPVWLSHEEAMAVLAQLKDEAYFQAALMYGAGMRVTEVMRVRRRDINWSEGTIVVRDGKGEKDRVTCLPLSIVDELRAQDVRAAAIWAEDRRCGVRGVWVPDVVLRKYPQAGEEEGNFWFIPAPGLVRGKRWGGNVRHHMHPDTFSKALFPAVRRARVLKKVTAHVFRHTFATQYLLNGGVITDLAKLLGHTDISTTQIYAHCLPHLAARIASPLDQKPGNIVELPRYESPAERRAFA